MLSRLKRQGVIDSNLCVHCWGAEEIEEHILYECRFTRQLWRRHKQMIGYKRAVLGTLEQELQWLSQIKSLVKIQNDGVCLVFTTLLYWMWRAHNEIIFQGKLVTMQSLVYLKMEDVRIKLVA